uniref:Uncharacterized protein n=1 Tax=Picea glauca TaxID=3330 RepID=A0A117NFF3_PICGL|nr:hypothetical protein ABT39_MTgene4057 [Picea glauca]
MSDFCHLSDQSVLFPTFGVPPTVSTVELPDFWDPSAFCARTQSIKGHHCKRLFCITDETLKVETSLIIQLFFSHLYVPLFVLALFLALCSSHLSEYFLLLWYR